MNNTETYTSKNSLTNSTTCPEPVTASTIMAPEIISLLQKAIERNIIDVDEVLHQEEEMTKKNPRTTQICNQIQ